MRSLCCHTGLCAICQTAKTPAVRSGVFLLHWIRPETPPARIPLLLVFFYFLKVRIHHIVIRCRTGLLAGVCTGGLFLAFG